MFWITFSLLLTCSSTILPKVRLRNFTEVVHVLKSYPTYSCIRHNTKEAFEAAFRLKLIILANPLVCSVENKHQLRRRRAPLSWKKPVDLPEGTQISYCSDDKKCCTEKRTLNSAGTHYNLCRECAHLVTLPASYYPRQHYHITCQDQDFYETCFSGEGGCTTNMVSRIVTFNAKAEIPINLGHSCSCEIRTDSIFANYI